MTETKEQEKMSMRELSRQNADMLLCDTLLWQTQEACANTIKAISKYNRTRGIGMKTDANRNSARKKMIYSFACLSNCIDQLCYLYDEEDRMEAYKLQDLKRVHDLYKKEDGEGFEDGECNNQ